MYIYTLYGIILIEVGTSYPKMYLRLFLCSSWTRKLIPAFDHAAVQLNVGHLDENGVYDNTYTTFAICGKTRQRVGLKCSNSKFNQVSSLFLEWQVHFSMYAVLVAV